MKGDSWVWFEMVDERGNVKRYSRGEAKRLFAEGALWPLEEKHGYQRGDPSQNRHC